MGQYIGSLKRYLTISEDALCYYIKIELNVQNSNCRFSCPHCRPWLVNVCFDKIDLFKDVKVLFYSFQLLDGV